MSLRNSEKEAIMHRERAPHWPLGSIQERCTVQQLRRKTKKHRRKEREVVAKPCVVKKGIS